MPARPPVIAEHRGSVAHVVLDRPHTRNAMDVELARGLEAAVDSAAADDAVQVMLLSATGPWFCAGADVEAMHSAADRGTYVRDLVDAAHRAVRAMEALPKPIVTLAQGPVAGAGLSLVLLSDLVLASPQATFTTAYTSMGLSPDCGQSWLLPRAIGLNRALELTLQPRRLRAEEAQQMGLITRVVVSAELAEEADVVLRGLVGESARASGAARALLRSSSDGGFAEHLDREAVTIIELAGTADAGARMSAVLDARSAGV